MYNKLCLNSRDDLLVIDLKKIAFFQASGNFTRLYYICGDQHLLSIGISKMEELIRKSYPSEQPSPFVRMGRSLIINQTYLSEISLVKQRLVLSDFEGHNYNLAISKQLLKEYKEQINGQYMSHITSDDDEN